MPTARERLRLVASGRYLYAIGGGRLNPAGPSLTTVERYDPTSKQLGHHGPDGRVSSVALRGGAGGTLDCATEADATVLAIGGFTRVGGVLIALANVDALSLKPRDLRPH